MRACIAVLLLSVALVACGGVGATVTPLPTFTPVPLPPTPTPTRTAAVVPTATSAAPARVGQTVTLAAYSLTLNRVDYPTTPKIPPPVGQRLVSFDVTITAKVAGLPYNPIYGKMKMADNTEGQPWIGAIDPGLQPGTLQNQETVRGWITFAFPSNAQPVTFVYEPTVGSFGNLRVVFDLR